MSKNMNFKPFPLHIAKFFEVNPRFLYPNQSKSDAIDTMLEGATEVVTYKGYKLPLIKGMKMI